MEILGIGPLELVFILLIALIILGPQEMTRVGKIAGRFLRKIMLSPTWREIRNLPYRIIREAGIDEIQEELKGPSKTAPRRDSIVRPTPASKTEATPSLTPSSPRNIGVQDSVASEWITPATEKPAAPPDAWTTPPSDETIEEQKIHSKGPEES